MCTMLRTPILGLLLLTSTAAFSFADEEKSETTNACDADRTTLRLYFSPAITNAQRGKSDFTPEVARIYVDGNYVGDSVTNLHGYAPTLRFANGERTIRVEMSGNRKFESKILFLGQGSTQLLVVDFKVKSTVPKR